MQMTRTQGRTGAGEALVRERLAAGAATLSDIRDAGATRRALESLVGKGEVLRVSRDVYRLADADGGTHPRWQEIAAKYPVFAVCLLSAAMHHGLTTQMEPKTWIAVPLGVKPTDPGIHRVQWQLTGRDGLPSRSWTVGMETVRDGSRSFMVTGPARTVVDLWRMRNRIPDGDRIFLEALDAYDTQSLGRPALHAVAREFGVADKISALLTARSTFTSAY